MSEEGSSKRTIMGGAGGKGGEQSRGASVIVAPREASSGETEETKSRDTENTQISLVLLLLVAPARSIQSVNACKCFSGQGQAAQHDEKFH